MNTRRNGGFQVGDLASVRRAAEAQVDAFLRSVGIQDPAESTDEDGWRAVKFGMAGGVIGVQLVNQKLYLRVSAPISEVPSDQERRVLLMRELLAMNLDLPGPARAGVSGDRVYVTATVPVDGLRDDDVAYVIDSTLSIANGLIRPLRERYGDDAQA